VDVALLEADGIDVKQYGKECRIEGDPWTGFTNLPRRKPATPIHAPKKYFDVEK
jgi:hypothetical protein